MSVLSIGKPSQFQTAPLTNGAVSESATWADVPIPKEGSLKLTPTEGQETTITEEGGDIVDIINGKTTYVLEFDEFVKKGGTSTFTDNDGVVAGEHAFRVLPEDDDCEGILIDRSKVSVTKSYAVADGIINHIKARVLKPKTGNSVKSYKKAVS